jgi:PIN domain nuclease of toxin-antitoxin system
MSFTLTNPEPLYVLDTHALIWYLRDDAKLSPSARAIFLAAEANRTLLLIPAIVIAELYYVNLKHKWFADFTIVFNEIVSKPFVRFVALEHTHILDFKQDDTVPEMHDRIIAGVARRLGVPLISSDIAIAASGIIQVIW